MYRNTYIIEPFVCLFYSLFTFIHLFIFKFFLAELPMEQIVNLQRREALAYESDAFEQATKEQQSDTNRQEKLDLELRQLRKLISNVKVTCEASTMYS